jgi:hypothetical protein
MALTMPTDVNSKGRGVTVRGRRGGTGSQGVRMLNFCGGLAHSFHDFLSPSPADVASTLVSYAHGRLAASTPYDREFACQLLAMAENLYRNSGRIREADETLTLLEQVNGSAPVERLPQRLVTVTKAKKGLDW